MGDIKVSFSARQMVLSDTQTQDLYDPREQWASYFTNALQCRNTALRYGRLQSVCLSTPDGVE